MARLNPARVLVVIAAYDEEKKIGTIVRSVRALGFPVLVVDDGSKDATARTAREAGADVFPSEVNEGKGASIRKGIARFLEGSDEALVLMDADGQHDPADLSVFVDALESAGVVIGNRMHDPGRMPWLRRVTNRAMSGTISFLSRRRVPDTQCGYRAFRREALSKLRLETSRFEIETEMILEAGRTGAVVMSVPIRSVYEGGFSHIRPARDTARFFSFLFRYLLRSRLNTP
jgi:glycosyltransferase involved in cell wall biosynthesis